MNPAGKSMLKGSGIGLIIMGALYILCTILLAALAAAAVGSMGGGGLAAATMVIGIIVALIAGGAELIAGIVGVKNADKPEKSKTCLVWGIIVVIFSAISLFSSMNEIDWSIIFPVVTLVLGILMIMGANKNKTA